MQQLALNPQSLNIPKPFKPSGGLQKALPKLASLAVDIGRPRGRAEFPSRARGGIVSVFVRGAETLGSNLGGSGFGQLRPKAHWV